MLQCLRFSHVLETELADVKLWLLFVFEGVRAVVPGIDGAACNFNLFYVLNFGCELVLPLKFGFFWAKERLHFTWFVLLICWPSWVLVLLLLQYPPLISCQDSWRQFWPVLYVFFFILFGGLFLRTFLINVFLEIPSYNPPIIAFVSSIEIDVELRHICLTFDLDDSCF